MDIFVEMNQWLQWGVDLIMLLNKWVLLAAEIIPVPATSRIVELPSRRVVRVVELQSLHFEFHVFQRNFRIIQYICWLRANIEIIATNLIKIENVAISSALKLPPKYQNFANMPNEKLFKRTPEINKICLKLASQVSCYDEKCMNIKMEDLKMGKFRVDIHIKSLYIGVHDNGKYFSLHLSTVQIQNLAYIS